MRIIQSFGLALVVGLAVAAAPKPGLAATYDFTVCAVSTGCNGGASPFGQATTSYNAVTNLTTVTIDLSGTYQFFAAGQDGILIAFNVTGAPTLTVDLTSMPAAGNPWSYHQGSVPGNPPDGSIGAMNEYIQTTVNNLALGDLATFTIVGNTPFAPNSSGNVFAVDICTKASATSCLSPTNGGGTGWIGAAAVPSPTVGAGLPGLVVACGGLLGLARRRRNRVA